MDRSTCIVFMQTVVFYLCIVYIITLRLNVTQALTLITSSIRPVLHESLSMQQELSLYH
jgi:hypothetical protein